MVKRRSEKKVKILNYKNGKYGKKIRVDKSIPAYTITELPPLTQAELDELALSQLQRGALDD